MLKLSLRKEFCGSNMPGTVIALRKDNSQGATEISTEAFLRITYPTADVIKAIKTVRANCDGGPVVLMGGRGKGKSHLMAVLHHAIANPAGVEKWLKDWSVKLADSSLAGIEIAKGFLPISETLSDQEYSTIWDLLFDRHPNGNFYKGKFKASNTPMPSKSLMVEMFQEKPTCLILDEFQTWFDSLFSAGDSQMTPERAFNFIQILSEISKDHPDILKLIVSLRDNTSDAFKQIHRQGPVLIDFAGATAKQDRQKLILHRLFENRLNIPVGDIESLTSVYASERYRLLFSQSGASSPQKVADEVTACWPFAPELLNLLEDQILMTTAAQETRDMIRILAMVFKSKGESTAIITTAQFSVEEDSDGVQSLVDSIASETDKEKLREIAQSNLQAINESGETIPHKSEMVASIWMHSMAPDRKCGVKAPELQLALSATAKIDDNKFRCELANLVDHSINIHSDVNNQNYWFELTKNTKTEVRVIAQNDNLWSDHANANLSMTFPGKDTGWIIKTLEQCFTSAVSASPSDIVVLGPHWNSNPWSEVKDELKPEKWRKLVLIVIPEAFKTKEQANTELQKWLFAYVKDKRNRVRFLIQNGAKGIFSDQDLRFAARCSYLCSPEGLGNVQEYRSLKSEFDKPLTDELKSRFDRYAVLHHWDYITPSNTTFEIERLEKLGLDAPLNVETLIQKNHFDLTVFNGLVMEAAKDGSHIKDLMETLLNPSNGDVLPYLGEQKTLEMIQQLAADGKIAMNHANSWYVRQSGESAEGALMRIRSKTATTGSEMEKILLSTPEAAGGSTPIPSQPHPPVLPPTPGPNPPQPGPEPPVPTPPSFTGDNDPVPPVPPVPEPPQPKEKQHHCEASNTSTLIGKFEQWGVEKNRKLKNASLHIEGITVQDFQAIIQRLKSNYKASMDVSYDEEEQNG